MLMPRLQIEGQGWRLGPGARRHKYSSQKLSESNSSKINENVWDYNTVMIDRN